MREAENPGAVVAFPGTLPALVRVLETARDFLSCRAQVTAIALGRVPPPRDLGEAIDRDFLIFDLERAAEALRQAIAAVPASPVDLHVHGARDGNRA